MAMTFGFVVVGGAMYLSFGIWLLLYLGSRYRWFLRRMQIIDSEFVGLVLIVIWPITIPGFIGSHFHRLRKLGYDQHDYQPARKAAA